MIRSPIRVLFVVPDLRVGGAERHVTTLLPKMDRASFTPSVVCIGDEGDLFSALSAAEVEATALKLRKRQAVRALWELVAIMRRTRPDIVVVRGYSAEALGRIAARISGVRHTVVWVHNIGDAEPRGHIRQALDQLLMPWTSGYFGVAEAQRPYLVDELKYPYNKVRIIHNGVDPSQFDVNTDREILAEFGFSEDDRVIGTLAALRPEKDHGTFLRAARHVIDAFPHAKFLVVGDGPMRCHLEALCTDLGISRNVHFAGQRSDVARLLRAIDVFVLSSVTVECFPISLLEAMASGRPAVCTAVGGVPELLDDGVTGYLVPPQDPRQLATRVLSLLWDPQTAHRMGRAARDRIESEFDLDHSVARAQWAIEEVVYG
jgi:glycosyltransferase involved in cell wall biosynthesis